MTRKPKPTEPSGRKERAMTGAEKQFNKLLDMQEDYHIAAAIKDVGSRLQTVEIDESGYLPLGLETDMITCGRAKQPYHHLSDLPEGEQPLKAFGDSIVTQPAFVKAQQERNQRWRDGDFSDLTDTPEYQAIPREEHDGWFNKHHDPDHEDIDDVIQNLSILQLVVIINVLISFATLLIVWVG